jgi:hypothetical protein
MEFLIGAGIAGAVAASVAAWVNFRRIRNESWS